MANTFKVKTNAAMPASAGTFLTLYTGPSSTQTIVIGLTLCNVHTGAVTTSVKLVSNTSEAVSPGRQQTLVQPMTFGYQAMQGIGLEKLSSVDICLLYTSPSPRD